MVSNASDDLPEPDRPVRTMSLSRGSSIETSRRLCSRAPRTTSLSATGPSVRAERAFGWDFRGLAIGCRYTSAVTPDAERHRVGGERMGDVAVAVDGDAPTAPAERGHVTERGVARLPDRPAAGHQR